MIGGCAFNKKGLMNLGETANALHSMLRDQMATNGPTVSRVKAAAGILMKAVREIEDSSSGSNFGYHAELYFGDFERSPHGFNVEWGGINGLQLGWSVRKPEEVKTRIEGLAKIPF